MTHDLVRSLRFARSEFVRGLDGLTAEEGIRRFLPMNSISWNIGHLASQENWYWVRLAQGRLVAPGLHNLVGTGKPASTPPLDEMWAAWREVTAAADAFLDTVSEGQLGIKLEFRGREWGENIGTLLLRNTHHYWFHLGECMAVRQLLGHTDLPEFVGDMAAGGYPGPAPDSGG